MKPYQDFINYIHGLNEYLLASPMTKERVDYVISQNQETYENALSGRDIEAAYKLFYRYGNTLLNFTGHKTNKELIESIYGAGACERREEQKRLERENQFKRREEERIAKQKEFELNHLVRLDGSNPMTIQKAVDTLVNSGFRPVLTGRGVGRYYIFRQGEAEYKMSRPHWRRKYVMEYIAQFA